MALIDEPNLWIAVIGVLVGILVSVIVGNHFRKKNTEDAEKILKNQTDIMTQNVVDIANAQERVRKIGGEVVYRENKEVGADLKGGVDEQINTSETVVAVLNPDKQVVSQHTKKFIVESTLQATQSPLYNETLWCGCKAKDKVIVKLCQSDRQRYIVMNYESPEGYYISDHFSLL